MQMTKRVMLLILSAISAVCIVCAAVLMFGITASADESTDHNNHSTGWTSLTDSALEDDSTFSGGNYYLYGESNIITLSSSIIISGNVTLCMNGCLLNAPSDGSAIIVESGTLTLCSCNSSTFYYNVYGSGLYTWSASSNPNSAPYSYTSYGLITDGVGSSSGDYSYGGGVYVAANAKLEIYDVDISGNTSNYGGGVYVAAGGTFEMYSGSIFGNVANTNGGGVYVDGTRNASGAFTMENGNIYGNIAAGTKEPESVDAPNGAGGGVYSNGTLTITGGSMENNTAAEYGGGMYINYGNVNISGNFILLDNEANKSGSDDNGDGIRVNSESSGITVTIGGGFILDTVSGGTSALSIQGGYYPASAVSSNTVYGSALDTNSYILLSVNDLSQDEDLQNFLNTYLGSGEENNLVAYGVYTLGINDFEVSYVNGENIVYDGAPVEYGTDFIIQVKRNGVTTVVASDEITITYPQDEDNGENTPPTNAGTYTLTITPNSIYVDYENKYYYPVTARYATLKITRALLTDNTQDVIKVYDGNAYGLEFALDGFVNGESLETLLSSGDATIEFSRTGDTDEGEATDWTTEPLTVTYVADSPLTVYYRITFTNYETVTGSHTITITKASVPEGDFPETPSVSVECGTALSEASLPTGWVWADGNSTICWGDESGYAAYFNLAGKDTSNYDWAAAAEEAGMIYNEEQNRLEYSVAITVTHTTDKLEHVDAKEPTCEETGNYEYWYCGTCENYFSDKDGTTLFEDGGWKISALGHYYGDWNIVSPTEESTGSLTAECSRCDSAASIVLPILGGESYTVKTESATCTEEGSTNYYYTNSEYGIEGLLIATTTIPATGHSFTAYDSDGNATCTEDGTKTAECDNGCGETDTQTDEGSATGHLAIVHVEAKDATYDEEGNIEYWYCEDCGTYFSDAEAATEIAADSVMTAKLTHTLEIILLCVGGAVCIILAAILIWQITKKRRVE